MNLGNAPQPSPLSPGKSGLRLDVRSTCASASSSCHLTKTGPSALRFASHPCNLKQRRGRDLKVGAAGVETNREWAPKRLDNQIVLRRTGDHNGFCRKQSHIWIDQVVSFGLWSVPPGAALDNHDSDPEGVLQAHLEGKIDAWLVSPAQRALTGKQLAPEDLRVHHRRNLGPLLAEEETIRGRADEWKTMARLSATICAVPHESVTVGKEVLLKGEVEVIVEQGNVLGLDLHLVGLFDENGAVNRDRAQPRNCHAVLLLELEPV